MKYAIRFTVILSFVSLMACTEKQDLSWDVLLKGLPNRITIDRSAENAIRAILTQTHETLLRSDRDVSYYSKILQYWDHNADDTQFWFCLKPDIYFSKNASFKVEDLKNYFDHLLKRLEKEGLSVIKDDSCVSVTLQTSMPALPEILSRLDYAPTKASLSPAYEWGLGPYEIVMFEQHQIILKRKKATSRGFDEIHYFDREFLEAHHDINERTIEDFTKLPLNDIPGWVSKEYKKYFVKILQSRNLIINITDEKLRQTVYHCMDIDGLREAFSSGQSVDIKTILPLGFPGARAGRPDQNCAAYQASYQRKGVQLSYFDWRATNPDQYKAVFNHFFDQTGIRVNLHKGTTADMINNTKEIIQHYDLYVLYLGTSNPHFDPVVGSVMGPDLYVVNYVLPEMKSLYQQWSQEIDAKVKAQLAVQMADLLAQHAVALPLTQDIRNYYYPKGIKGLNFSRTTTQNPEIADLYR